MQEIIILPQQRQFGLAGNKFRLPHCAQIDGLREVLEPSQLVSIYISRYVVTSTRCHCGKILHPDTSGALHFFLWIESLVCQSLRFQTACPTIFLFPVSTFGGCAMTLPPHFEVFAVKPRQ